MCRNTYRHARLAAALAAEQSHVSFPLACAGVCKDGSLHVYQREKHGFRERDREREGGREGGRRDREGEREGERERE